MLYNIKEIINTAAERLEALYPDAECSLEWCPEPHDTESRINNGWKLLIMGRLSAQCTDARVNIVCRELFSEYKTCGEIAGADLRRLEIIIKPCGLFRTKASDIKNSCTILTEKYGGLLPDSMEKLLELPGVGRKIANLLLGDVYRRPAVVADTHLICICGRLGVYDTGMKDPLKAERAVAALLPPEKQNDFCHRLVMFGRDFCRARNPGCDGCPLSDICTYAGGNGEHNG